MKIAFLIIAVFKIVEQVVEQIVEQVFKTLYDTLNDRFGLKNAAGLKLNWF